MIKTQSTPAFLPLAALSYSPPLSPYSFHPSRRPARGLGPTSSFLRRHSVPLAILINVILQPQSRYLQFVSREDAKSRRTSSFHSFSVPSPSSFTAQRRIAISPASISVSCCIMKERDVLSLYVELENHENERGTPSSLIINGQSIKRPSPNR